MSPQVQPMTISSCIYCSSSNRLSDEHIVPYSLGGSLTLKDASCENCSDITKKFEQICARNMFGSFRTVNRLPTRRKHQRPNELELLVEGPSGKQTIKVLVADHPGVPASLPLLPPPGMRVGPTKQLPQPDTAVWLSLTQINRAKAKKIADSTGAIDLSVKKPEVDLLAFMRLLAKVAHGAVHAMFHASGFVPFLPDYILGKDPHLPFVVGGATQPPPPGTATTLGYQGDDSRLGHRISCGSATNAIGQIVLMSHIQLFSFLPYAPVYEVFVATVPDINKLMRRRTSSA
jgi:hypothetical protein